MVFINNRNHDAAISPFFEYIYYLQEVIFVLLFIIYYIHFDRVTIRLNVARQYFSNYWKIDKLFCILFSLIQQEF